MATTSAPPAGPLTCDNFTPTDECILVRLVERQNMHQTITNFTYLSRQFRKVATAKADLLDQKDPRFYTASRCSLAYNRLLKCIAENASSEPGAAAVAESLTSSGVRKSGGSRKGPSVLDLLVNEALPSILVRQLQQLREDLADKQKDMQELCDLIDDVSKGVCDDELGTLWLEVCDRKAAEAAETAAAALAPPPPESPARVPSSPSILTSPTRPDTRQKTRTATPIKQETDGDEATTRVESPPSKGVIRSPVAAGATPSGHRRGNLRSSASTDPLDGTATPPRSVSVTLSTTPTTLRLNVAGSSSTPGTEETPRRRGRPPKRAQRTAEESSEPASGIDDVANDETNKPQHTSANADDDEADAKRARITPRKPPTPATEEQINGVRRIFRALWSNRDSTIFRFPVTEEEAPDYDEMVIQRMDLSTIRDKIGPNYSVIAFYRDFMLMIQNALMYNSIDSEVYQMAITLKRFGKKEFAQILPTVDRSEAPLVLRSQSGPMRLTRSSFQ